MAPLPVTEVEIWDLLNRGEAEMSPRETRLWEAVRVTPEKWQQHPYGDALGGFWIAGLMGRHVVWHNEIEGGFDISPYHIHGLIDDYTSNQYDLKHVANLLLGYVELGHNPAGGSGPPRPGKYPG
jgi:hypothetical protein